jgi:hypothetical protein
MNATQKQILPGNIAETLSSLSDVPRMTQRAAQRV